MEKTNVFLLLKPKVEVACLSEKMNVRQAIEKMKAHGYLEIPVLSKSGEYLGTITDSDLLWRIVDDECDLEELEEINIKELIRKDHMPAAKMDADINELTDMIMEQNFVPVVDDRNILMGIVTRKRVLQALLNNEA